MLRFCPMTLILALALAAQDLPLSISEPAQQEGERGPRQPNYPSWYRPYENEAGLRFGYLSEEDADDGTWFLGFQLRQFFKPWLAGEFSVEWHQSNFEDEGVKVNQFPIQLSAVIFPFPRQRLRPYVLAGVGWYVSQINIKSGNTALVTDETETTFGFHAGFGADFHLTAQYSIGADVRYVAVDEGVFEDSGLTGQDLDYWQVTMALNFKF